MSATELRPVDADGLLDVLRISTAGSVDDGKSTLIGRLLYDSRAIPDDQLEAVQRASTTDDGEINLALLTDGLRAEREQQITIDVAYRYFGTSRRRFIIADTPGHAQYTRNMVTGASTADIAIILVDARKGLLSQSRRHTAIASLLRVPRVLLAVNKIDLVDYSEEVFKKIEADFKELARRLDVQVYDTIPISALNGDNVVTRSEHTPWYSGPALLDYLETVPHAREAVSEAFRFPVQCVIRPNQNFRGFAGRIASGEVRAGDELVVLPRGQRSKVKEVLDADGALPVAGPGDSVVITLDDEIDISRGDLLVSASDEVTVSSHFDALVCWMSEEPLGLDRNYVVRSTTREVNAFVQSVGSRLNIETLDRESVETLQLNEIGDIEISTAKPLVLDSYGENRVTGSFVLIDPVTNVPVAAGMVRTPLLSKSSKRAARKGHLVNTSRATAPEIQSALEFQGARTARIDADALVAAGFSLDQVKHVGQLFAQNGITVIAESDGPLSGWIWLADASGVVE